MSDQKGSQSKPFISAIHRHDLLPQLAQARSSILDDSINASVSRAITAAQSDKIDGKNGGVDGLAASVGMGTGEIPWGAPNPPPKTPGTGKEGDEGTGKEAKDSGENTGKEAKDGKESGKDSSDGVKTGGSEVSNPLSRFGDRERLNWSLMNQAARLHGIQVSTFLKGVRVL